MKRGPGILILLFSLWLTAVPLVRADEETPPPPTPAAAPAQPVEPKEVLDRVSKVRGLPVQSDVPIQYMSRETVAASSAQASTKQETRDSMARAEALLRLLDLLPDDSDLSSSVSQSVGEQLGGLYSFNDKSMLVVPFRSDQSGLDEITLAHEYTHALQDQNLRLGKLFRRLPKDDSEASLGLRALAEGDAEFTSMAYLAATKSKEELNSLAEQAGGVDSSKLDKTPPVVQAILTFPYEQGMQFVAQLYRSGGWNAINKAYERPPLSSEQILHVDRYLAGDNPKPVQIPDVTKSMSEWSVESSDVFGEVFFIYYLATQLDPETAAQAAEGWGGDSYLLLKNKTTGKYALADLSTWDTENDAMEFEAAVQELMDERGGAKQTVDTELKDRWASSGRSWYVSRNGSSVLLAIGPDDDSLKSIVRRVAGFRP